MDAMVTVVGVGALGSHLVQFLRNEPVSLKVVDFDRVESKNVQSQFHGKQHVGKLKVASVQQTMQFLYGTKMLTVPHKLVADNVPAVLRGSMLVVDCLDNLAGRRLIKYYVGEFNIPCVHGALAADGSFGRVIWEPHFIPDEESGQGAATCENGEFLPFIALTAAYMAKSIQHWLAKRQRIGYSISPVGAVAI